MQDSNSFTGDAVTVLVQTVTKSIESTAGLSVKVDHINDSIKDQGSKLDGVLVGLAELKIQTTSLARDADNSRRDITDHETRIRVLEPALGRIDEHTREIASINTKVESLTNTVVDVKSTLIRYGAVAACAFFVLQLLLALFVIPWAQRLIGN
jgi:chromosome segregation ATPase